MAQTKVIDFDAKTNTPGKNCTWKERDRYPYAQPLTDNDRIELAKEMATLLQKIEKLELERKASAERYKMYIDGERSDLDKCARYLREGAFDPESRDCDVYQDWDTCELVWITHDEERIEVHRRPMTKEERQPTLFNEAPDAPKTEGK